MHETFFGANTHLNSSLSRVCISLMFLITRIESPYSMCFTGKPHVTSPDPCIQGISMFLGVYNVFDRISNIRSGIWERSGMQIKKKYTEAHVCNKWWNYNFSQQTQDIDPVFVKCWASVVDAGPALIKHWVNVLCLLAWPVSWRQSQLH